MSALICGALAYDTIMVFEGSFADHILSDQLHRLSVSFHVPKMRREFGGCAGNIAYNLSMLGAKAYPMAVVGHDFGPYRDWLDQNRISRRFVRELETEFTAQAFITTDLDDNQITAFHPGAMACSVDSELPKDADIRIGVVAPDVCAAMWRSAERFVQAGIPFLFDPGQFLHVLSGEQILAFLERADWVTVNGYEAQMMAQQSGCSLDELSKHVRALVVTHGKDGCDVIQNGDTLKIPAAVAHRIKDPTGCGDAFRAGLLFGLMRDLPLALTGRIASVMGAVAIECHGTQNHRCDMAILAERFAESFDVPLAM